MGMLLNLLPGARMFQSFLHPEKGYEKAQQALLPYYNQSQGYLQPYQEHGQEAYGHLSGAMSNLLNPQQMYSDWTQGYEESPYSKQLQAMARDRGMDAAAAMGLSGSTPALQSIQAGTTQLANADRQQYFRDLVDMYKHGAQIAQGIYGTGANAAGQMGSNAANMGSNMAQLAYNRQNAPGQLFNNLINKGMDAAAYGFGGGF